MMLRQKPTEYIPRDIKGTPDGGNWVSLGGVKGITESFNGFVLKVCGFSRACRHLNLYSYGMEDVDGSSSSFLLMRCVHSFWHH